jgi:hypothetical protein
MSFSNLQQWDLTINIWNLSSHMWDLNMKFNRSTIKLGFKWKIDEHGKYGISPATCGIYQGKIGNFNHQFMWDCLYIEMVMSQKPILNFRNPRQITLNNSEASICFNHQHWDLNGKVMKHGILVGGFNPSEKY